MAGIIAHPKLFCSMLRLVIDLTPGRIGFGLYLVPHQRAGAILKDLDIALSKSGND
jgi:hypothetical protein